jgi:flagellar hook-associated protein 2
MSSITFSGLASGIDTNALIDAITESSRTTQVAPYQRQVDDLEETNSAFEELASKVSELKTTLSQFTSVAGGGLSKSATSSRDSVASATLSSAATNGSYSLSVTSIAKNATYSFGAGYSSETSALGAGSETVTYTVGTGADIETVSFNVTAATTVTDFVTSFNAASSKAEASLVNVGTSSTPSYKVVISSSNEGLIKGQLLRTSSGNGTWLTGSESTDQAANASFSIAGIGSITRSTNTVSDVISGVSFSLSSTGSATIKISEDAATTSSAIQTFVDQYNEIVSFVSENNLVTRTSSSSGSAVIFGALSSSRTDDNFLGAMRSALASSSAAAGSTVRIFADIGITTARDGTLTFDTTKFQSAAGTEASSVSALLRSFADTTSLTGGTFDMYTRFGGFFDSVRNSNTSQITTLSQRIADAEEAIGRQASDMRSRFARLESVMSRLQGQQSSLSSLLSLGTGF